MPAASVPAACAAAPTVPTFRLGNADCPYKGSLAWAAALQSPSYLINDGKGQLYFKDKTIVVDKFGSQFLSSGQTYKISMSEFELIREMGRGQYGVVLLVRHLPSGRLMALKDIGLELSTESLKNISMELDVLTMASATPYILEFYGAFHNRASIFLCLEYMDVGSLESLYKTRGRIPECVIRAIALPVVRGLRFLTKELRVMHRDVKPSNILVNTKGAVKLCDFGVSGYLVKSLARTQIGSMCYMAPERIVMEQETGYTAKADVWSLGVTLYESAMAEPLFGTTNYDSPFAQLMAVVNDPPPTLSEAEFSPDFRDFIQCCFKKDPKERASFDELLVLTHDILEHPFLANYAGTPEEDIKQWVTSLNLKITEFS